MSCPMSRTAPMLALYTTARAATRKPRACFVAKWLQSRQFSISPLAYQEAVSLRKYLKDEAKKKKKKGTEARKNSQGVEQQFIVDSRLEKWELTVGIEIHAELNTACKLFSNAPATVGEDNATANSRVALFDAAVPGTQPRFQEATLLPALRAAIALGCKIQRKSAWDRKHYFHWDQPNGYQITQYYEPFAKDGSLTLTPTDGIPSSDFAPGSATLDIGIKQVQMEQDTAKTTAHGHSTYHIDLNRAGHPLIEIITLPHIHSPQTAAAVVRKIQAILKSIDACVTGMELGGLRADVNVSVRERGTRGNGAEYSGVTGLGQRTEIKNLSSFKAVEDAIVAERDRQIALLEAGGIVEGETRGWTLGEKETRRLRGKEGEVDYRYMPDPDLGNLVIGEDLVEHLRITMPELPSESVKRAIQEYGLSEKDAKTIVSLDDGDRLEFLQETVDILQGMAFSDRSSGLELVGADAKKTLGTLVGNQILHELGGFLEAGMTWNDMSITPKELADVLANEATQQITPRSAKQLLATLYNLPTTSATTTRPTVEDLIEDGNLRFRPLSATEYDMLAKAIMDENPQMVANVQKKGNQGKLMWFVGQMMRREGDRVEPSKAQEVFKRLLDVK